MSSVSAGEDRVTHLLALVGAAIPGIPALIFGLIGLAAGYAWESVPFNLVVPGALLACVPIAAWLLSRVGRRIRVVTLGAAVILLAATSVSVAVFAVILLLVAPLALLDDSGRALVNLESGLGAATIGGFSALADGALLVGLLLYRRQRSNLRVLLRPVLRASAVVLVALILAALAGALAAAQTDAAGIPAGPINGPWLSSRAEAHLVYPGADAVETSVGAEVKELAVANPAVVDIDFYSRAEPDAVSSWYSTHLRAAGWQPIVLLDSTTDVWQIGFRRGSREVFSLEFLHAGTFGRDAQYPDEHHFRVRYEVYPPGARHA